MDVDWDFFLGMIAAFMLCFSWSRYKSGPKKVKWPPPLSKETYILPPAPYSNFKCPTRWVTSGSICTVAGSGIHQCFLNEKHESNHTCLCDKHTKGLL